MAAKQAELVVFGPHPIPFKKGGKGTSKRITKEHAISFWAQDEVKQISNKQGCYVFALKVGKGFTPWYVGQASKNFKQEALHSTKLVHFNDGVNPIPS